MIKKQLNINKQAMKNTNIMNLKYFLLVYFDNFAPQFFLFKYTYKLSSNINILKNNKINRILILFFILQGYIAFYVVEGREHNCNLL